MGVSCVIGLQSHMTNVTIKEVLQIKGSIGDEKNQNLLQGKQGYQS